MMVHKRFKPVGVPQAYQTTPAYSVAPVMLYGVMDTYTLGLHIGTHRQVCACDNMRDAELVADALNHYYNE